MNSDAASMKVMHAGADRTARSRAPMLFFCTKGGVGVTQMLLPAFCCSYLKLAGAIFGCSRWLRHHKGLDKKLVAPSYTAPDDVVVATDSNAGRKVRRFSAVVVGIDLVGALGGNALPHDVFYRCRSRLSREKKQRQAKGGRPNGMNEANSCSDNRPTS